MSSSTYSSVTLDLGELKTAKRNASKVCDEIDDYIENINKKVIEKIDELTIQGSYTDKAASFAEKKISQLLEKKTRFETFSTSIGTLVESATEADKAVGKKIESVADKTIGKRNWFQKSIGDPISAFFVSIGNKNQFTRAITNFTRKIDIGLSYGFEKAKEWFKYGEGQYIFGIIMDIAGIFVSVYGTIVQFSEACASVAAAILSGGAGTPLAIIECSLFITSLTSTIIGVKDKFASIDGKLKAIQLYKEGNPAAAKYYGEIDGVTDYVKKTDLGDSEQNESELKTSEITDTVGDIAGVVDIALNVSKLGVKYDYRYDKPEWHSKGFDFSKENISKNFTYKAGYRYKTIEQDGVRKTIRELDSSQAGQFWKNFTGKSSDPTAVKIVKTIENTGKVIESTSTIVDYGKKVDTGTATLEDGESFVDAVIKIDSFTTYGKTIFNNTYKPIKKTADAVEDIIERFGS